MKLRKHSAKMNIVTKFTYFVIIVSNMYRIVLPELLSENYCNADNSEDAEALSHWYSQVYNFVRTNQNVTQHMIKLNETLFAMAATQKQLSNQQNSQNIQVSSLKAQLDKIEAQMSDMRNQHVPKCTSSSNEIVIQRRQDGSENFYRTWEEYKQGFGNTSGEFFMGLEELHKLTNTRPHALLIALEDWKNQRRFAKYDLFVIGSELEKYALKELGAYSGTAGDSLSYQKTHKFSTKDQENDINHTKNCAERYKGAWWYNACHRSNLNGLYIKGEIGNGQWAQGIHWYNFSGHGYSLKFVEMILIRI